MPPSERFREIRGVEQRRRSESRHWFQWRRGRGSQHLKLRRGSAARRWDEGELALDGVMPYTEVEANFAAAAPGLPPEIAALVADKIREFARPSRKWPFRKHAPRWLERARREARLAFLDSAEADR